MKIEKLKYFLDLFDSGSYTQTAKMNYISQTSVTQFINSLEEEFNVKLFNRSTIPITPTEAGKAFYKKANVIYTQYCSSLEAMKIFSEDQAIPLNICYTSPIDLPILMPMVMEFKKIHPEIRVNISKKQIKDTVNALNNLECDMVLGLLPPNHNLGNDILSRVLYRGHFVCAISKNDPYAQKKGITTTEAYAHPMIMLSHNEIGENYDSLMNFLDSVGIKPNVQYNASDIDSELFMIATEQLLGFIPDDYDLNYFDDYIVKLPLTDYPCPFSLHLTYKIDENPSVSLFLDFLDSYSKNQ